MEQAQEGPATVLSFFDTTWGTFGTREDKIQY